MGVLTPHCQYPTEMTEYRTHQYTGISPFWGIEFYINVQKGPNYIYLKNNYLTASSTVWNEAIGWFKYVNKAEYVLAPSYFNVTLGDQQKPKKGLKCKNHRIILKISY